MGKVLVMEGGGMYQRNAQNKTMLAKMQHI